MDAGSTESVGGRSSLGFGRKLDHTGEVYSRNARRGSLPDMSASESRPIVIVIAEKLDE